MTEEQKAECQKVVEASLERAEKIWNSVGKDLQENFSHVTKAAAANSQIPGYPIIDQDDAVVDTFVCLIADMRQSTKHIQEHLAAAKVSRLERVFYETSALLPALAKAVQWEGGGTTEYLGDGILALFRVVESPRDLYSARRAAKNCLKVVEEIVDPILAERYDLPPLDIGVGLSMSKAVVLLVGLDEYQQPKVFGECVYRATKLADGFNEIKYDPVLRDAWPTSKSGTLKFVETLGRGKQPGFKEA